MFENWAFLLGEIWVLLILAALLGLLAGWIIWGRRETVSDGVQEHVSPEEPRVVETSSDPKSPKTLGQPRDGTPDDLKKIKGIGPKMEKLCNGLGFYHFDQIANWTLAETAWVDENLEGFKGRVTRDNWVAQAKELIS